MTEAEILKARDSFYEQKIAEYTLRIANALQAGKIAVARKLETERDALMSTRESKE